MNFKRSLFAIFLIIGALVFMLGKVTRPILVADRSFLRGLEMRSDLSKLRLLIESTMENDDEKLMLIDDKISEIETDLERVIDDGRKRHYSNWRTDVLAVGIVVVGLIITLVASWRADTK